MGATFVPVDEQSNLPDALNSLVFRDSGASGYGQRIIWTDYDGVEIDRRTGVVSATGKPTLKIRQTTNGFGIQVRKSDDTGDLLTVQDSGVSIGTPASLTTLSTSGLATLNSLAVTNNATVGGTLGVTGAITGSSTVQGTRLISTVGTGTAPLTVSSTSKVTSLNADLLDDRDTGTGAGNIAFYNGSTRVVDSELVAGKVPGTGVGNVAFYDGSGRVADSQLLDGVDGSGYSVTSHTHSYLPLTGGTISGALSVGGLTSTAALTAGGTITASGPATGLSVTNNATIGGTLTMSGTLDHDGSSVGFFGSAPNARQTVTGSRGANAALTSLLSALANYGLVTDSST